MFSRTETSCAPAARIFGVAFEVEKLVASEAVELVDDHVVRWVFGKIANELPQDSVLFLAGLATHDVLTDDLGILRLRLARAPVPLGFEREPLVALGSAGLADGRDAQVGPGGLRPLGHAASPQPAPDDRLDDTH